ncbi:helix-turn-helix domain-containing protein [Paenibacillus mendelii]|nr:helix-turn-helix domain-containing protein [Paenibacillus mendelii]
MKNGPSLSDHLASYLYKLDDIQHIHSTAPDFQHETTLYGMLLFKQADGDIQIGGTSYPLHRQKVFILAPDTAFKLRLRRADSADYYYIRFHALQAAEQNIFVPATLNCPDELSVSHFSLLIERLDEMERKQHSGNGWDAMKANILFQELLGALFKDANHGHKQDVNQALTLTMEYMEQNYRLNISRKQLAEMVGISEDYYSRAFKKQAGKSPMEYLAEIRVNQAKQSLLLSGDSFRSIAQSVGFSDEFYFSRKFKATTGRSPTSYVNTIKYSEKIASLKHLLTGHLIALGVEPYAAIINNAYPITTRLRNTVDVGDSKPDLEKLMTAKPDLIITRDFRDFGKTQKERMYNQIAPTVTLPFDQNWRIHLQTVGKIIGRDKEASDWLERYEYKVEAIRRQVMPIIRDETILIVGIGEGQMCVYGQRNLGSVLYGDLKLAVPHGVTEIKHFKEVTLADLPLFDADRILLTSYKHDGSAHKDQAIQSEVRRLYANKQWRALKAVRNQAVYNMYDSQHHYTCYTSLSHDLFLDKARQLFMSDSSKQRT